MLQKPIVLKSLSIAAAAVILLTCLPDWKAEAATTSGEIRDQITALEEEGAALQEQMEAFEAQLQENSHQIGDVVLRKNQIDQQVSILYEQIRNTNAQISAFAVLIADKQAELDAAEKKYDQLHEKYIERIRVMEEQGNLSYWSILFKANNFVDLLGRLEMVEEIASADNRRLQELREAAEAVNTAKNSLEKEKEALELVRSEQEEAQRLLELKSAEAEKLLQELLSKGAEYEKLLEESENKQEQLMDQIANMENEYDQLAYQEWLATSVPETTPSTGNSEPSGTGSVTWVTPVTGYTITSVFGMRFHPILDIWRMHNGVDMACPTGTPIYATRSGIVTVTAYEEYGAGNYVQINHGDGYRSIYMHMNYYIVSPGEQVSAGQIIGYVGTSGLSDGPHLHFGISYNGTYVNPMEYIR